MKTEYPWKRFLCPPTGSVTLDNNGFVRDPDTGYGDRLNPDLLSFDKVREQRCVIFLGEPGIGKSVAMKNEYLDFSKINPNTLYVDLRSFGSEGLIVQEIFKHEKIEKWMKGQYDLFLFLDSFDECINSIPNLTAVLVDRLRQLDLKRLYLRIACRTDGWTEPRKKLFSQLFERESDEQISAEVAPVTIEQGTSFSETEDQESEEQVTSKEENLTDLFEYEVVPLRSVDVEIAAEAKGVNFEKFLSEVGSKEVSAFASRPVTLEFLLDLYKKDGSFPHNKKNLYQRGCWMLCDEPSPFRAAHGNSVREYEPEQYLAVASRMAAISIFSKKTAFHIGNPADADESDIGISQICSGKEVMMGNVVEVDAGAIRQTIATGLFSSRGSNRYGWSHQTYAEFLAAQYLANHAVDDRTLISLIVHPEDPEGKIITPLTEVAAWLATMNRKVFQYLLEHDPEILLRSDLSSFSDEEREQVTESLLKQYEQRQAMDDLFLDMLGTRKVLQKLYHKNLGTQLSRYIFDRSKNHIVRRVAIDTAENCRVIALQGRLADLALDQTENYDTRIQAAYAVMRIGDHQTLARLKPLANGTAGNDPDDELRGVGLKALWPSQLSADELFTNLTTPQRTDLAGAYSSFRFYDVIRHLKDEDVPRALIWLINEPSGGVFNSRLDHMEKELLMRALKLINNQEVRSLLGSFIFDELSDRRGSNFEHDSEFYKALKANNIDRRKLLETIVNTYLASTDNQATLFWTAQHIASPSDATWSYKKAVRERNPEKKDAWIELFNDKFGWTRSQIIAVLAARIIGIRFLRRVSGKDLFFRLILPQFLYKKLFAQPWERLLQEDDEEPPAPPDPLPQIHSLLDEFEAGDINAWPKIADKIGLNEDGRVSLHQDMTLLPRWGTFNQTTKDRIIRAAEKFVLNCNPTSPAWITTDTILNAGIGGYKGLHLAAKHNPSFLENLPDGFWAKWTPMLVSYPLQGKELEKQLAYQLVKKAYLNDSNEVINAFISSLDGDNQAGRRITKIEHIEECFGINGQLEQRLSEKLSDSAMTDDNFAHLLRILLEHKVELARETAIRIIENKRNQEDWESKSITSSTMLMRLASDAGWPVLWPIFQTDQEFGKKIVESIAVMYDDKQKEFCSKLSDEDLKDFYIWLIGLYPLSGDPHYSGVHAVGTRENAGHWRDGIIQYLTNKGTLSACNTLKKLEDALPTMEHLRYRSILGRRALRQNWHGFPPKSVIDLATNPEKRLVQNSDELMKVLIESLQRLEEKLHGEVPAARDIWDSYDKKYKPISEEEFSDYLVRHLQSDLQERGIVANREVRIHRVERTDIHVSAVIPGVNEGTYSSARVIIEVKGCWHDELKTSMEKQLRDRYLRDNNCTHGLYLVGWFLCDHWAPKHLKSKKAPKKWNIQTAKGFFEKQAEELSGNKKLYAYVMDTTIH